MNDLRKRYGDWALVAGAAEGIGEAFTRVLAGVGMNVIMVDINPKALQSLSEKIKEETGVTTRTIELDLSTPQAADICMEAVRETGCRLMIYVAAFSKISEFLDLSSAELDRSLQTNTRTVVHLVHQFAGNLKNKGTGGVLLISSLAGLIGAPLVAPYAATKGFNILLAESLHHEFKTLGIDVTACCAGVTVTPMFLSTKPRYKSFKPQIQQPEAVARYGLKMLGRKAVCISGAGNRLSFFILNRLLPRGLVGRIMDANMRSLYNR